MWWKVDCIWQLVTWPAQCLDQEEAPEHFPKPNVHHNKVMVTSLLQVWSTTIFWISVKPLNLRIMLSQWIRYIENCKCLQLALVNRKGLILCHGNAQPHLPQPKLWKLKKLSYKILPHPPYSLNILPTNYHFFKHLDNLLQGKCFHNQQEAENAFQEFAESQSMDFSTRGVNEFISHWQKNVLIVMVPILINKDMFEPSYNYWKFTVQSHNYFCTTLSWI